MYGIFILLTSFLPYFILGSSDKAVQRRQK